jgi:hypothetical protein
MAFLRVSSRLDPRALCKVVKRKSFSLDFLLPRCVDQNSPGSVSDWAFQPLAALQDCLQSESLNALDLTGRTVSESLVAKRVNFSGFVIEQFCSDWPALMSHHRRWLKRRSLVELHTRINERLEPLFDCNVDLGRVPCSSLALAMATIPLSEPHWCPLEAARTKRVA